MVCGRGNGRELRGKEVKGKEKRVEERKVLLLLFCGGYAVAAYKSAVVDR